MNNLESKKTLIIGASDNPSRYANIALHMLQEFGHPIIAIGKKRSLVSGVQIETESNCDKNSQIDTVTLYINPLNQAKYIDFILDIKPKRVIFNPGTENAEFQSILDTNKIPWEEACTLVLLRSGQY